MEVKNKGNIIDIVGRKFKYYLMDYKSTMLQQRGY